MGKLTPMPQGNNGDLNQDGYLAIAEWVFIHTMADIRARITDPSLSQDRYHMLGLAPLLRKLLIDGGNLVSRVNRNRRLPIEFAMNPFSLSERECIETIEANRDSTQFPVSEMRWRMFAPGLLPPTEGGEAQALKLQHFLRATVGMVTGKRLSVKDLILFYCIVEGGVHIGEGRTPLERDLISYVPNEFMLPDFGIDNSPIASLFVCAEIVYEALLPLLQAVEAEPTPVSRVPGFEAKLSGMPRHRKGGVARN